MTKADKSTERCPEITACASVPGPEDTQAPDLDRPIPYALTGKDLEQVRERIGCFRAEPELVGERYQAWRAAWKSKGHESCPMCDAPPLPPTDLEVLAMAALCAKCGAVWSVVTGFCSPNDDGRELVRAAAKGYEQPDVPRGGVL